MLTEERVVHVVLWTTTNETALRSRRRQKVIYFRIPQTTKRFSEVKARKEKEKELVAEIEGEEEQITETKTQPAKKPEVKENTKAKVVKF